MDLLDERGNVMIEFAICFLIFMLFVSGITMTSFWGIGNAYIREAAFEAARSYAVYEDAERAKEKRTYKEIVQAVRPTPASKQTKILVGGLAVTPRFSKSAGADAYGADADMAVTKALSLVHS